MEQTHDSPTALELYKGHPVQEAAQIILGSLLFSASMNWIILPHDMYSGGFLGIAQLLRMLLLHFFPAIQQIGDLAGILYFLLNTPLLLISWFRFGHFFFAKTALCIVCYSAFLALIPIPAEGLFDETIAACVIGGLVCGVGHDADSGMLRRRRGDPGVAVRPEKAGFQRGANRHDPECVRIRDRPPPV